MIARVIINTEHCPAYPQRPWDSLGVPERTVLAWGSRFPLGSFVYLSTDVGGRKMGVLILVTSVNQE